MRDRLIELIEQKQVYGVDQEQERPHEIVLLDNDVLADHLIANGVIVLPCRVGQTVYRITNFVYGETLIVEGEVFEFTITNEHGNKVKNRFYFYAKCDEFSRRACSLWCNFDEFGKTVFLTREEAEKALKERSEK